MGPNRASRWRPADLTLYAVCAGIFFFLAAPTLIVVPMSFSSSRFMQFPPPGFSLRWYENYFATYEWTRATVVSLQVAAATAFVATVLGTLAALGLRFRFRGKNLANTLLVSPMVVPVIIIAIALYFFYAPFQRAGVPLIGSRPGLILAHTALAIPFVIITVSATLRGLDANIERAAQSLGAGPLRTFFRVTFPLIRPGVIAGALFAFITSFDEIVIAIFISGVTAQTLPVKMWEGVRLEVDPTLAAVSSLLIGISAALLVCLELLRRRAVRLRGG